MNVSFTVVAILFMCILFILFCENHNYNFYENENSWQLFKKNYGKSYRTFYEENFRKKIFFENLMTIIRSNLEADLGRKSYRLSINQFADLTPNEFRMKMTGLKPLNVNNTKLGISQLSKATSTVKNNKINVPLNHDWRLKGVVSPVRDQGECSACWAFTAASAIESHTAIKMGKLVNLSAQNLIDCVDGTVKGCDGGLMEPAFDYVKKNGGIATESSYPYEEKESVCRYRLAVKGASCKGYVKLPPFNEETMKAAVATKGPVCVGMDGFSPFFQFYESGIYDDFFCSNTPNHAMLIVGYGTSKFGDPYWIVKNSWGTGWGYQGYAFIARNENVCGIATMPSYPLV